MWSVGRGAEAGGEADPAPGPPLALALTRGHRPHPIPRLTTPHTPMTHDKTRHRHVTATKEAPNTRQWGQEDAKAMSTETGGEEEAEVITLLHALVTSFLTPQPCHQVKGHTIHLHNGTDLRSRRCGPHFTDISLFFRSLSTVQTRQDVVPVVLPLQQGRLTTLHFTLFLALIYLFILFSTFISRLKDNYRCLACPGVII